MPQLVLLYLSYSSFPPDVENRGWRPGALHIRQMVGFFRKDLDREDALVFFWPRLGWFLLIFMEDLYMYRAGD